MDIVVLKNIGMLTFFLSTLILIYNLYEKKSEYFIDHDKKDDDYYNVTNNMIHRFRFIYKIFLPLIKIIPSTRYRLAIKKNLITAGLDNGTDPNDFIGFQLFTCLFFGYIFNFFLGNIFGTITGMMIGASYPFLWLYEKKKARHDLILSSMPDIIDMLYLSLKAGIPDIKPAIQKVCEVYKEDNNPFAYELYQMYRNIEQRGMSMPEAYKTLSDRIDLIQVYSLTSLWIQTHEMGSSIADCLKTQSSLMHQERFINAEKKGALASQKLLLPLILLIFPILLIIIFGPYLLKFMYDGTLF